MAMTSPLYCINNQQGFKGRVENQRIMLHDETYSFYLDPLLKNGSSAPACGPYTELNSTLLTVVVKHCLRRTSYNITSFSDTFFFSPNLLTLSY